MSNEGWWKWGCTVRLDADYIIDSGFDSDWPSHLLARLDQLPVANLAFTVHSIINDSKRPTSVPLWRILYGVRSTDNKTEPTEHNWLHLRNIVLNWHWGLHPVSAVLLHRHIASRL
jgi:hypothetical protein